jgi:hypothetical protein
MLEFKPGVAAKHLVLIVIPAKAGIHRAFEATSKWIPAFAGMTAGALS